MVIQSISCELFTIWNNLFAKIRIIFQIVAKIFDYFTFCYHISVFLINMMYIYTISKESPKRKKRLKSLSYI